MSAATPITWNNLFSHKDLSSAPRAVALQALVDCCAHAADPSNVAIDRSIKIMTGAVSDLMELDQPGRGLGACALIFEVVSQTQMAVGVADHMILQTLSDVCSKWCQEKITDQEFEEAFVSGGKAYASCFPEVPASERQSAALGYLASSMFESYPDEFEFLLRQNPGFFAPCASYDYFLNDLKDNLEKSKFGDPTSQQAQATVEFFLNAYLANRPLPVNAALFHFPHLAPSAHQTVSDYITPRKGDGLFDMRAWLTLCNFLKDKLLPLPQHKDVPSVHMEQTVCEAFTPLELLQEFLVHSGYGYEKKEEEVLSFLIANATPTVAQSVLAEQFVLHAGSARWREVPEVRALLSHANLTEEILDTLPKDFGSGRPKSKPSKI